MKMARKGTHHRGGNEQVVIVIGSGDMSGMGSGVLAKTIEEDLIDIGEQVTDDMEEIFEQIGKEAANKLKQTSPKNPKGRHSGRYAKGWTYDKGKRTYNFACSGVVRNKTDPQLTHLLEYGHPLVRDGRTVGNVAPISHIGPVADWVAEEIEKRISKSTGG